MPLTLVPLQEEMAAALSTIYLDAFTTNPANTAMIPVRTPEVRDGFAAKLRATIRSQSAQEYSFAVVDTDLPPTDPSVSEGEIIAYCRWKHELPDQQEDHAVDFVGIPGTHVEARKLFFQTLDAQQLRVMQRSEYMHLMFLATSPKHGGRGAARLCLEWGVKKADELRLPAYLDATPPGKPIYEKFGFEMKDSETIDLRPYGVDVDYSTCAMVRPAKQG